MSVFRLSTFFSINSLGSRSVLCSRHTLKCCDEQRMSVSNKKVLEKLGIPLPPKKPLTPYLKYVQQVRSKIVQNETNVSPQDALKIVGKQWSEYDPEQKKVLQKEYLHEVETYLVEIEKYKKTITPEQQELIKNTRDKLKRAKELASENQKKESLGKPKKPPTYFLQFIIDRKAQKPNNVKYSDWIKSMVKEWENISPSEKQKYDNHARTVLEKYKSDMLKWEESMVRQGHLDVVRNKEILGNKLSKKQSTKATV